MITLKILTAGVLLTVPGYVVGPPAAQADPLVPLSPAELQFLEQARSILPRAGDPIAFNSDGELLDQGRLVCVRRDDYGLVGTGATLISSVIAQLAFVYLCPR